MPNRKLKQEKTLSWLLTAGIRIADMSGIQIMDLCDFYILHNHFYQRSNRELDFLVFDTDLKENYLSAWMASYSNYFNILSFVYQE